MRRFEFAQGTSSKFWEVGVDERTLHVRFGRTVVPRGRGGWGGDHLELLSTLDAVSASELLRELEALRG